MFAERARRGLAMCVGVVVFAWSVPAASVRAQCLVNLATGLDEDTGEVLAEGVEDLRYLVDDGFEITVPFTGGAATGFPVPPWVANDENSVWISSSPNASDDPGNYSYEITVELDVADASRVAIEGRWATDDPGVDVIINEQPTGITAGGFTQFTDFPLGAGLGLFQDGDNTIRFVVQNGGAAANPTGVRVEACLVVVRVEERPLDISTGFARGEGRLLDSGESSDHWTVTAPGEEAVGATAVADDAFPFPPWLANGVLSRWIGTAEAGSSGAPGEWSFTTHVTLPAGFPAEFAEIRGGFAADDRVVDVLVNGESVGVTGGVIDALTSFPALAGRGAFVSGDNEIVFIVDNAIDGSVGLRVDATVVEGNPDVDAPASLFSIDTGYDDAGGVTIGTGAPDDHWVIIGPEGIGPAFATVGNGPVPPWVGDTAQSRWIGTDQGGSNGPPGDYVFRIDVELPAGVDAENARLVGWFSSDNLLPEIVVNGVSTGIAGNGNFTAQQFFDANAGLGLFQEGVNRVEFRVNNAPPGVNPVGLRVEAVVGTGAVDPGTVRTGVGQRGIGPLPAGVVDGGFEAEIAGIGARPASVIDPPNGFATSDAARWIAVGGVGEGDVIFRTRLRLPPEINAHRAVLAGGFAGSPGVTQVLVNGEVIEGAEAGLAELAPMPVGAGRGAFVPGENLIEFVVPVTEDEDSAALLADLFVTTQVEANELDISTGFDQAVGAALSDDELDDDWLVIDPFGAEAEAVALAPGVAPIPPWLANTESSRWVGIATANAADPGEYRYQFLVELTEDEAATATIEGFFAVDDGSADVSVNEVSTGVFAQGGFTAPTYFPQDTGLGLFAEGQNVIEIIVVNGGEAANPSGLRVDAIVAVDEVVVEGPEFVRGDADASGAINITDGIFILNFLFLGGGAPPCLQAGDADDSGALNITDGIFVLNFLFLGGVAPPAPHPDCGPADAGAALGCESFAACP